MSKGKIISIGLILLLIILIGFYTITGGSSAVSQDKYSVEYIDLFDTRTEIAGYETDGEKFAEDAAFIKERLTYYNQLYDIYNSYDGINNIKTINDNLNSLKVPENEYEVIKNKDLVAIESFKQRNLQFDLVILDPPYGEGKYEEIVEQLFNNNLLSEKAIIVMEANRDITLENIDYQKNKAYHYGDITVYIYWRQA